MRACANHLLTGKLAIFAFLFGLSALTCLSQDDADRWLRVLTDEDSFIEVDRLSLVLEPDQVIRADFRTTFVQPVSIEGGSYQSRLDSIEFRLNDKRYRIRETKLVDSSGHVISSSSNADMSAWKSAWGRTGSALFSAATQLQPFGTWKIISYRYPSGEDASKNEPPELNALVGAEMYLGFSKVRVAGQTCDSPIFEPTVMKGDEFSRRIGSSLESLGMTDKSDALYLRCVGRPKSTTSDGRPSLRLRGGLIVDGHSNRPPPPTNFPTTLILRRPDNRILMLWNGVFLELERTKNIFLPRSY